LFYIEVQHFTVVKLLNIQEREQFALVFPPTPAKSTLAIDELVDSEHFAVDNYEVGLVVTTCDAEQQQQQLNLRLWLVLTNQRELFPRLSLDSRHQLMLRVTPEMPRSLSDGLCDINNCVSNSHICRTSSHCCVVVIVDFLTAATGGVVMGTV